jgi:hypothetical protein
MSINSNHNVLTPMKNQIEHPQIKDLFQNFFIIILLYLYIFQPPVINKLFFIGLEAILFFFVLIMNTSAIYQRLKVFKVELTLLLLIIFHTLFRDALSGKVVYFDRFLAWGFQSFIVGLMILFLLRNNKTSIINLLYWTALLAAVLSVMLLLFPAFDRFYESIQIDSYYEIYESFEVRYRAYGISENLTFTYSFIMGLFAGYSFFLVKRNLLFIIPMFIFVIAMIFNARIGIVGLLVLLTHSCFIQGNYRGILKLVVGMLISGVFLNVLATYNNVLIADLVVFSNLNWVSNFFVDIFSGDNAEHSTLSVIFGDFIIFPDESISELLIGTGESLFGRVGQSSDLGFILQIYYGGFTFFALILVFISICTYRLCKTIGIFHWFTSFFFIMVVVLNIKGFIFAATPGGRLLFFLYLYFIYQHYTQHLLVGRYVQK